MFDRRDLAVGADKDDVDVEVHLAHYVRPIALRGVDEQHSVAVLEGVVVAQPGVPLFDSVGDLDVDGGFRLAVVVEDVDDRLILSPGAETTPA